jgi:hypothetical protein
LDWLASPVSPAPGPRSAPAKQRDTLESDFEAALGEHLKGRRKSEWAVDMAEFHGWNAHSVQNWLARPEIDKLWRGFGGLATSPKMRGRRHNG